MNNPEANFMSPLRTQPIKKQRGGSTPTSLGKQNHRPAFGSRPTTTATATATATATTSNNSSSGPPPQRDLQASADDAIARRRAELRRLTGQRNANANAKAAPPPASISTSSTTTNNNNKTNNNNSDDWMAQARSTLGPGAPADGIVAAATATATAGPPLMPPMRPVTSRASDIFPTVDKPSHPPRLATESQPPMKVGAGSALRPAIEEAAAAAAATSAPPVVTKTAAPPTPSRAASAGRSRPPPRPPASPKNPPVPPSAKVARRLEASFAEREARAKSAPPARPPPGGPPTKKGGAKPTPPPTPTRATRTPGTSRRPTPMSPSSLLSPAPAVTKQTTISIAAVDDTIPNSTLTPSAEAAPEPIQTPAALKKTSDAIKTPAPAMFSEHQLEAVQTPLAAAPTSSSDANATPAPVQTPSVPVVQTTPAPVPAKEGAPTPPSTGRRDKIRSLRASADTPPSLKKQQVAAANKEATAVAAAAAPPPPVLISETTTRLEQELKTSMQQKNKALELIANLEHQLSEAQSMQAQASLNVASPTPAVGNNNNLLSEFLQLRSTSGDDQALQWAHQQVGEGQGHYSSGGNESQVGFMSPMMMSGGGGAIPTTPMAGGNGIGNGTPNGRRKIRMATPHPKKRRHKDADEQENDDDDDGDDALTLTEMERKYHDYFIEAAHTIPHVYSTELATFTVRRPYGLETDDAHLFRDCSLVDHDQYAQRAHISSVASLELAVTIHADNNLLLLHSAAGVRYQNDNQGWNEHPNVDDLDRPLGNVSYIDTHANDQDYSLDQVVEEALLTRELYGSSMMNAALAFKERQPNLEKALEKAAAAAAAVAAPPSLSESTTSAAPVKDVMDMCVGTDEDLPFPPETVTVPDPKDKDAGPDKKDKNAVVVKKPPASEEAPAGGGGGSDMFTMLFGLVLSFFWSLIVKTPFNIMRMTITMLLAYAMVSLVLLYAADQHASAGSNPYYYYNRPGVY